MFDSLFARLRGSGSGARIPTLFPEYPRDVEPPQDVLREIRDIDPDVDLLYLGWGKWALVRLKPNREHIETGARRIRDAKLRLRTWETHQGWKANPGAFQRLYGRYLYWLMVCQGGRPIAQYTRTEFKALGFRGVIDDLRCMLWMQRHLSDGETLRLMNKEKDDAMEEARSAFSDEYAAKDVCDYLNKRTFSSYNDQLRPQHRSGFTTVAAVGADGTHRSIA